MANLVSHIVCCKRVVFGECRITTESQFFPFCPCLPVIHSTHFNLCACLSVPAYREQYLSYTVDKELQRLATEVIRLLSQSTKEGDDNEQGEKSNSKETADTVKKLVNDAELLDHIRKAVAQSKENMAAAFERREKHRRFAEEYKNSMDNKRNHETLGDNEEASHHG